MVPFLFMRIWGSCLYWLMWAFCMLMFVPGFAVVICSFHRQSLICPVGSVMVALATVAQLPNLVMTYVGLSMSVMVAFRLTFFMPTLRSFISMGCCCCWSSFLCRWRSCMYAALDAVLMGLPCSLRNSSGRWNWAMTLVSCMMSMLRMPALLFRSSTVKPSMVCFLFFWAAVMSAVKSLSGSISYFNAKNAR